MKKRILSAILCLVMLLSALPMTMFAADETVGPFTDVKPKRWYTDAVKWCFEQGYMEGTSETTFSPSGEMTRAMFATVLAAMADVKLESAEYKGTFSDVAEGRWYTAAVEWAAENELVSGIGGGAFGRNNPVTRETVVLMVYKFMQMSGAVPASYTPDLKALDRFTDADKVHDWAKDAVAWALDEGVIEGSGVSALGEPTLSPRRSATRAEVAVIICNLMNLNICGEYPVGSVILGGTDLSEFVIVYGETGYDYLGRGRSDDYKKARAVEGAKEVAESLAEYIAKLTGVTLSVVADTQCAAVEGANEILVGKTNREDAGFVTVDREGVVGDAYLYEMQGSYLIIASDERYAGTYMARNHFLEQELGLHYYAAGIESYESIREVKIEDGKRVSDTPDLDYFCNYAYNGSDKMLSNSESYLVFGNGVHSIPGLACRGNDECEGFTLDYDHHAKHHKDADPCLSDSDNIRLITENIMKVIAEKPDDKLIWLSQSDGVYYCKCTDCAEIYRTFGRCATYVQLLNYVGEAIAEKYPEHKLVGLAYKYTMRAPDTSVSDEDYATFLTKYTNEDIVPPQSIISPDNVIVCICTDTVCASHALDDPNCNNTSNSNVRFNEYVERWDVIVSTIYAWDYVDGPRSTPYPNILEYRTTYAYFDSHGLKGLFAQASTRNSADFGELRTYLISRLVWDLTKSEQEYSDMLNSFLEASYGDGWTYIRAYIDLMEQLSSENEWHTGFKQSPSDILTAEQWEENSELLGELWAKALKLARTSQQRSRVSHTRSSFLNAIR